jgi:hypothetical protein
LQRSARLVQLCLTLRRIPTAEEIARGACGEKRNGTDDLNLAPEPPPDNPYDGAADEFING